MTQNAKLKIHEKELQETLLKLSKQPSWSPELNVLRNLCVKNSLANSQDLA